MSEPKLLDQVWQTARLKHFSLRTERADAQWVYRFARTAGPVLPRTPASALDVPPQGADPSTPESQTQGAPR
jgi:hypothetical protein